MKNDTYKGLLFTCDDCGCRAYSRMPTEENLLIWDYTFWHCPHCGLDFKEYISVFDNE